MSRRTVSGTILFVLLVSMSILVTQPAKSDPPTITVPDDYPTIQEAIDNANEGDTVFVRNGTYYEKVIIDKSLSLVGENRNTTIIDGERTRRWGVAINYTSHVIVRGFTVLNSGGIYGYGYGGVYLEDSDNCIITDNILFNNQYGIGLYDSSNNVMYNNLLIENAANVLVLSYFHNLVLARNNTFFNNTLTGAPYGPAFELCEMTECTIINNTIANNRWGIYIREPWGTYPDNNHTIHHNNLINNTFQIKISTEDPTVSRSQILWDDGCEGNYWSNYNGTDLYSGPYQNETGSDGIGDTPYVINENNTDHFPLMKPYGIPHDIGVKMHIARTLIPAGHVPAINISVSVINYGKHTENINITCQTNTTSYEQIFILANRNSTTLLFTWNTTDLAKGNYIIEIFAEPVPEEIDTTDNYFLCWLTISMIGDITGPEEYPDGKVDMRDIGLVALYFGQNAPPAPTNCDVVYDGKIDMKDIGTVARHFGETDP